jgi:predicted transcriptional regulator
MVTVQVKLSVEDIIASLSDFNNLEREKLQDALLELKDNLELQAAIDEGLADVRNGRVSTHESVMSKIKLKYNYK